MNDWDSDKFFLWQHHFFSVDAANRIQNPKMKSSKMQHVNQNDFYELTISFLKL